MMWLSLPISKSVSTPTSTKSIPFDWSSIIVVDAKGIMQTHLESPSNTERCPIDEAKYPLSKPPQPYDLVVNGFDPKDIRQGEFGTCYFLTACASCAQNNPSLLYQAVSKIAVSVFRVRLYDENGYPIKTSVDTWLPLGSCSSSSNPNELWVSILEKGYAMLTKSRVGFTGLGYEMINGGYSAAAMTMLCPGRNYMISVSDLLSSFLKSNTQIKSFCDSMIAQTRDGIVFFASFNDDLVDNKKNLKSKHAYSILDIKYIQPFYVFRIHNPWGCYEWKGDLSDIDTSQYSKMVHQQMNTKFEEDGIFMMTQNDFFSRINILEVFEPKDKTTFSSSIDQKKLVRWQDL